MYLIYFNFLSNIELPAARCDEEDGLDDDNEYKENGDKNLERFSDDLTDDESNESEKNWPNEDVDSKGMYMMS